MKKDDVEQESTKVEGGNGRAGVKASARFPEASQNKQLRGKPKGKTSHGSKLRGRTGKAPKGRRGSPREKMKGGERVGTSSGAGAQKLGEGAGREKEREASESYLLATWTGKKRRRSRIVKEGEKNAAERAK